MSGAQRAPESSHVIALRRSTFEARCHRQPHDGVFAGVVLSSVQTIAH